LRAPSRPWYNIRTVSRTDGNLSNFYRDFSFETGLSCPGGGEADRFERKLVIKQGTATIVSETNLPFHAPASVESRRRLLYNPDVLLCNS